MYSHSNATRRISYLLILDILYGTILAIELSPYPHCFIAQSHSPKKLGAWFYKPFTSVKEHHMLVFTLTSSLLWIVIIVVVILNNMIYDLTVQTAQWSVSHVQRAHQNVRKLPKNNLPCSWMALVQLQCLTVQTSDRTQQSTIQKLNKYLPSNLLCFKVRASLANNIH